MKTYNIARSYFTTHPNFSAKKKIWKFFLTYFDMTIKYRLRSINTSSYALIRKAQIVVLEEEDEFPTSGGT